MRMVWMGVRLGFSLMLGVALAWLWSGQLAALRAAGVTGQAPANEGAITTFVSAITDNALWLIGTIATLAILVIGGLFFFGHSRAGDYAAKIAIGAVVIVSAPGIAA